MITNKLDFRYYMYRKKSTFSKSNLEFTLMCIPAMAILFVFSYIPMLGIVLAFKNFKFDKGILGSNWSGFNNFNYLFQSNDAWKLFRNTIGLNFSFIIMTIIISVIFAVLLNEIKSKLFLTLYQNILFYPFFISWVVVSYMVLSFLSKNSGIINNLLVTIGIKPVDWYNKSGYWPLILLSAYLWKYVGYNCLIYFAGLTVIDSSYYEAADIFGASKLQKIRYISIPFLKSLIIIMFLLQLGKIFYSDFGLFYFLPMNNGVLYNTTDVLDTYIFRAVRVTGDMAMASAVNFFQSVIGFVVILTTNYFIKKSDSESAIF